MYTYHLELVVLMRWLLYRETTVQRFHCISKVAVNVLSLQYRISRLFVEKTATVISRGFQLKHIPSGEVIIAHSSNSCISHSLY